MNFKDLIFKFAMEWKTELDKKFDKIFENPEYNLINEYTVKELKEFCEDQQLSKTGNKDLLINKILKHLNGEKNKKPVKRKSIDPPLRKQLWEKYIGQKTEGKCYCCWKNTITPFTYCKTFHAGHIISRYNGGSDSLDNLLPICRDCNMQMGTENWDSYVNRHPHLPLRRGGKNPPISKYIKGIIWIQSLIRMWLERKNPESEWRKKFNLKFKKN